MLNLDEKRKCSKCGNAKSVDGFYISKGKINPKCKECYRAQYQDNSAEIRRKRSSYYYSNKKKVRKQESIYRKKKRLSCPKFKLLCNIRNHIHQFLKEEKKNSSIEYLGCSLPFFKSHLESKFEPGMSWENYGLFGWHIDHIFPLSLVDYKNEDAVKKYLHYTNLQPLWAKDNIKKGNKI